MPNPTLAAQVAEIRERHEYAEAQRATLPLGWGQNTPITFSERCHGDRATLLRVVEELQSEINHLNRLLDDHADEARRE